VNQIPRIGFVGFGEAGFHLAKGLRQAGMDHIAAFDIADTPLIRQRARETRTPLLGSNVELAQASDIIFSAVTANQAAAAAAQTAPYLEARHLYADMNSVSPGLKQALAETIEASGARFVEVAVMSAVPPHGHKVPMLTGGVAAREFADRLTPFGMVIEVGSAQVGSAAATKMCRSIMIKGIEALLTECVLGATRYGADERVFSSLGESLPGIDWAQLASYMVGRVVMHGERRAREMEEVAETLRSAGVEPIMAEATVRRMDWSAQMGLKARFGGKDPKSYQEFAEVVAALGLVRPSDR
jgi:3-hydroxyisobutyrate dehydrogenase-like beta-hydroxyacid dehydrogenase